MRKVCKFLFTANRLERNSASFRSIGVRDLLLLSALRQNEAIPISRIATDLGYSPYEVSKGIARLERAEFVKKSRSDHDGRIVLVELTDKGENRLNLAEREFKDLVDTEQEERQIMNTQKQETWPECILTPLYGENGEMLDLRMIDENKAFFRRFQNASIVREVDLVSRYGVKEYEQILAVTTEILATGKPRTIEIVGNSGITKRWEFLPTKEGNLIVRFLEGQTVQKQEPALRVTDTRYENFFRSGPIKLVIDVAEHTILDANDAAARFYGWDRETLRSMRLEQITTSTPETLEREFETVRTFGHAILQVAHRTITGEARKLEVHVSQGFWAGHTVHFSIAFERPKNTEDRDDNTEDNQDLRVQTIPDGRIFEECIRRYGDDIPQLDKLLAKLIPYGRTVRYRKGEHYLEFGETSPNVGIIIDGMFRQYAITDEGKDCTINLLRPGQIFQPTTHSAYEESESLALEAVCGSRVFVIDTRYTEPLSHDDTRWYELLYRAVQERLLEAKRRAVSLLNENAAMRYDRFLREEGDAADLLHSYQIASYLGITAETLSRIRKRKK